MTGELLALTRATLHDVRDWLALVVAAYAAGRSHRPSTVPRVRPDPGPSTDPDRAFSGTFRYTLSMRKPTLLERLSYRLRGRWPDSYVTARLAYDDALRARCAATRHAPEQ